jgi:hypothetical protein
MLFHEIYGRYYQVLAKVLREACRGTLTREKLYQLIQEGSFGESTLELPRILAESHLLTREGKTPLASVPDCPLTVLEKRWLAAVLQDPRMQLFQPPALPFSLGEPLFSREFFVCYDRYQNGDPYGDPVYQAHFRQLLTALREKRKLQVQFQGRKGIQSLEADPDGLEYSGLDDKFRFLAHSDRGTLYTLRVSSLQAIHLKEPGSARQRDRKRWKARAVLELVDRRKALERALLHFSDLEKETVQLDEDHYRLTLFYYKPDETELLIRILAFGPFLKAVDPPGLVQKIKERLERQQRYER